MSKIIGIQILKSRKAHETKEVKPEFVHLAKPDNRTIEKNGLLSNNEICSAENQLFLLFKVNLEKMVIFIGNSSCEICSVEDQLLLLIQSDPEVGKYLKAKMEFDNVTQDKNKINSAAKIPQKISPFTEILW